MTLQNYLAFIIFNKTSHCRGTCYFDSLLAILFWESHVYFFVLNLHGPQISLENPYIWVSLDLMPNFHSIIPRSLSVWHQLAYLDFIFPELLWGIVVFNFPKLRRHLLSWFIGYAKSCSLLWRSLHVDFLR